MSRSSQVYVQVLRVLYSEAHRNGMKKKMSKQSNETQENIHLIRISHISLFYDPEIRHSVVQPWSYVIRGHVHLLSTRRTDLSIIIQIQVTSDTIQTHLTREWNWIPTAEEEDQRPLHCEQKRFPFSPFGENGKWVMCVGSCSCMQNRAPSSIDKFIRREIKHYMHVQIKTRLSVESDQGST